MVHDGNFLPLRRIENGTNVFIGTPFDCWEWNASEIILREKRRSIPQTFLNHFPIYGFDEGLDVIGTLQAIVGNIGMLKNIQH